MAGRGRGRGRGLSINIEALGLGRGEVVPSIAQPPPLFPPLRFRPLPLTRSSELDYMVALRQELRYSLHKSPYYVNAPNKAKDIERYSDKYMLGANDGAQRWEPDWNMFPSELQERKKKKAKSSSVKPNLKAARKMKVQDVSKLLEQAEPEEAEEGIKKEKNQDEDDEEDEEEYDEEDLEEETDYNLAYFDNGEGYGDEDEDDDEGPTY
ncbi:DNA-directed RNA polymerase iii subunit rpc7-like protein [Plakobranchus ocellatus]|uniref:DNA-directed RNA polymerase III subunit n=1 Tax=Plakobranchus ocellatus TaxID=259542 RepID=A0AAV4D9W6_9GAST|nr:DNA-directed RNA polymerase iii subunit rpc7-like protein [Plakobranchus ocellatus]